MNWDCPYCNRAQTITNPNFATGKFGFTMLDPDTGPLGLVGTAIRCANEECNKATVNVSVVEGYRHAHSDQIFARDNKVLLSRTLMPESSAKPQPDYIPAAIVEDYVEACIIRDLSPKSSATLARRCIQGLIRDFAEISEKTLFHEIETLKDLADAGNAPIGVSLDSIEALHHVRSLGNIGAHMERDINVIVHVDPDEAQILIELIENLFEEWYVARHQRRERLEKLKEIAGQKEALRKLPRPDQT